MTGLRSRALAARLRASSVKEKLAFLYGSAAADPVYAKLEALLAERAGSIRGRRFDPTEKDAVFITYADAFLNPPEAPLRTLDRFLRAHLRELGTVVHLLPFYPSSSDDGFSVVDYRAVDPALGTWSDVARIGRRYALMFDAVMNHVSARSGMFRGFLRGEEAYEGFFIPVTPETDTSKAFRPRSTPLSTPFETPCGPVRLWTTFSEDQVDLNYRNPDVLLSAVDVILYYLAKGAAVIRLDAVAFLWKESGSRCLSLPQTHAIVKLLREIFRIAAPYAKIVTETNLPHEENISYFGSGSDEAHLVYNFALPPLTAHALLSGSADALSAWARTLETPGGGCCFLNFTASHDGIGLSPAKGILTEEQIQALVDLTVRRGGRVSRRDAGGALLPYELNISLFDLLSDPRSDEPLELKVSRFTASQAIALSLQGLPAVYYHSLVGSGNCTEAVEKTGCARAINREKLDLASVSGELERPGTRRNLVYRSLARLLGARRGREAFHPRSTQRIPDLGPRLFAVERTPFGASPGGEGSVLCAVNVSGGTVGADIGTRWKRDILTGRACSGEIALRPYEILWLEP